MNSSTQPLSRKQSLVASILWFVPALAWAGLIFWLSATPGLSISSGVSDLILRKTAHVLVFAGLFLLLYLGFCRGTFHWRVSWLIKAGLIAGLYAIIDELHQSSVPTRNGNPLDVLIDWLGIGLAIAMVAWYKWWLAVTTVDEANPIASFNYDGTAVSLKQLPKLADKLAKLTKGGQVIALHGQLGAGKTTFTQELARALGVTKTLSSPTYTIEKRYSAANGLTLHHYDWYRLDGPGAVEELGFAEVISQTNAIIVVEWPDRAPLLLPDSTIHIHISHVDQQTRKIIIHR